MSLTEGVLTEAGGMRALEATSNRVREDYSAAVPTGATVLQAVGTGGQYVDADTLTMGALTADSLLVVCSRTGDAPTITDSGSHVWTQRGTALDKFGSVYRCWTAPNTGTTAPVIDFGLPVPSGYWTAFAVEVSGGTFAECLLAVNPDNDPDVDTDTTTPMTGNGGLGLGCVFENGGSSMDLVTPSSDLHIGVKGTNIQPADFGAIALNNGDSFLVQGLRDDPGGYWGWGAFAVTFTAGVPSLPPTTPVLTETFTGTNGAAWSMANFNYVSGNGAAETIQNNKGQVVTAASAFATEYIYFNKGPADFLLTFDLTIANKVNGGYFDVGYRQDAGGGGFPGYGIELEMGGSYIKLDSTGGAGSTSVTPPAFLAGDIIHWKIRAAGAVNQIRLWVNNAPEPSTWVIDALDTAPTKLSGRGEMLIQIKTSGAGIATTYTLDNIVLYDTPDPVL